MLWTLVLWMTSCFHIKGHIQITSHGFGCAVAGEVFCVQLFFLQILDIFTAVHSFWACFTLSHNEEFLVMNYTKKIRNWQ